VLLAGYEEGQIVLWKVSNQTVIKVVDNLYSTSVLQAKFYKPNGYDCITTDNSGNVHLLSFNQLFFSYTVDKKCLLSNKESSFCCIDILDNCLTKRHVLNRYTLVALGSLESVLVIVTFPYIRTLFKFNKPVRVKPGTVPSISWGHGKTPNR